MYTTIRNLDVLGISSCIPKEVFSISSLAELLNEKKINRVINSTGIKEVRIATNNITTTNLCINAAEHLIKECNIEKSDIDAIIFVSISPDYVIPATSSILQERLGLNSDVVTLDLNFGCAAYIYGLYQASILINAGGCEKVLLCVGHTTTKEVNPKDMSMKPIMGDAATATIVSKGKNTFNFIIKSDGSAFNKLYVPDGRGKNPYTKEAFVEKMCSDGNTRMSVEDCMDGLAIMDFAITQVPRIIDEALQFASWRKEDVETFAFHQANKLILDSIKNIVKIKDEQMPTNLASFGNTGSSTIPLLLSSEYEKIKFRLNKVLACGFGNGLAWGTATLDLSQTLILPPIEYSEVRK